MNFNRFLTLIGVVLCLSLISIACGSSGDSPGGVITVDTPVPELIDDQTVKEDLDDTIKTDEEMTTEFTVCLRDYGYDIPDPTLNADGSVDLEQLRISIMSDPKFDINSGQTVKVFEECLPFLEDATFAGAPTQEDQIELEDKLLKFAECIRQNGIEVPDPEFSTDPRLVMQSMFEGVTMTPKVEKAMEECSGVIFGQRPRR